MKKNIGIFLVMCIMLTACKNDKFSYDDELDDSEKNEISTEYDSLIAVSYTHLTLPTILRV